MEGGWSQAGKLQALQIFMLSVFFSRGLRGKMTRNIGIASAILAIHSQPQALELSSCIFKPELRMVAVQAWTPFH